MEMLLITEKDTRVVHVEKSYLDYFPFRNYYFYNILTCQKENISVNICLFYIYKFKTYFNRETIDILFEYITPEARPSFLYHMSFYGISPQTHILKMV